MKENNFFESIAVGDILCEKFFCDSSVCVFHQVTRKTDKSIFTREIEKKSSKGENFSPYVTPIKNKFIGKEKRRTISYDYVNFGKNIAKIWSGLAEKENHLN